MRNHAEGEEHLTLRERLSMHRERADCKGCHEQIDPLGFALENYDPIGVWRDKYENGRDVDMAGTLFRKHKFTDVVEFKDAILAEKDRFTRASPGICFPLDSLANWELPIKSPSTKSPKPPPPMTTEFRPCSNR